jgi:hypothetical protein
MIGAGPSARRGGDRAQHGSSTSTCERERRAAQGTRPAAGRRDRAAEARARRRLSPWVVGDSTGP